MSPPTPPPTPPSEGDDPSSSASSSSSPSPVAPTLTPEDGERDLHDQLVRRGGRPAYDAALIDAVWAAGRAHDEASRFAPLVTPFLAPSRRHDRPATFGAQLVRWMELESWQELARGTLRHRGYFDVGVRAVLARFKKSWDRRGDLAAYARAARRAVLEPRGLGALVFAPRQDPAAQDKLTTWLEYVVLTSLCLDFFSTDGAAARRGVRVTRDGWEIRRTRVAHQLAWIVAQIPLVRGEMRAAEAAAAAAAATRAATTTAAAAARSMTVASLLCDNDVPNARPTIKRNVETNDGDDGDDDEAEQQAGPKRRRTGGGVVVVKQEQQQQQQQQPRDGVPGPAVAASRSWVPQTGVFRPAPPVPGLRQIPALSSTRAGAAPVALPGGGEGGAAAAAAAPSAAVVVKSEPHEHDGGVFWRDVRVKAEEEEG
jgi:hypothetical protein